MEIGLSQSAQAACAPSQGASGANCHSEGWSEPVPLLSDLESGCSTSPGQDRGLWNPCCLVMSPWEARGWGLSVRTENVAGPLLGGLLAM